MGSTASKNADAIVCSKTPPTAPATVVVIVDVDVDVDVVVATAGGGGGVGAESAVVDPAANTRVPIGRI